MHDATLSYGELIHRYRDTVGLTQEALARVAEIGVSTYREFESDERLPPHPMHKRLCTPLQLTPEQEHDLNNRRAAARAARRTPLPGPPASSERIFAGIHEEQRRTDAPPHPLPSESAPAADGRDASGGMSDVHAHPTLATSHTLPTAEPARDHEARATVGTATEHQAHPAPRPATPPPSEQMETRTAGDQTGPRLGIQHGADATRTITRVLTLQDVPNRALKCIVGVQTSVIILLIVAVTLLLVSHLTGVPGFSSTPRSALSTPTVDPHCANSPLLDSPFDGQTITSSSVTFLWEAPTGCTPDGYTFRLSQNQDGEVKPWTVDEGRGPSFLQYTFPLDSPNGTYYWHVRTCKSCTPYAPGTWVVRTLMLQR